MLLQFQLKVHQKALAETCGLCFEFIFNLKGRHTNIYTNNAAD